MTPELERLRCSSALPTLPSVAVRLIELANDPDLSIETVEELILLDPVLSSKILGTANSAWYGMRAKSFTISQALKIIGLNAAVSLALSFSLVEIAKSMSGQGIDYALFWKRSLISAVAAKILGTYANNGSSTEELFIAALLQDIGMLSLCKADPVLYVRGEQLQKDHRRISQEEKRRFGFDHARIGAWLLAGWNLPERLLETIDASHTEVEELQRLSIEKAIVGLSGPIADLVIWPGNTRVLDNVVSRVASLKLQSQDVTDVLEAVLRVMPEIEKLFEMKLIRENTDSLLRQAKELMAQWQTAAVHCRP